MNENRGARDLDNLEASEAISSGINAEAKMNGLKHKKLATSVDPENPRNNEIVQH